MLHLWQVDSDFGVSRCSKNECDIPIFAARVDGREGGQQLCDDLAPGRSGASPGGIR